MVWLEWMVMAVGVLAAAVVGLTAYGASRWALGTRALLARLEAAREPPLQTRYSERELDGLPAPVQRYFRAALTDGQAIVSAVSVQHTGSFNMSQTGGEQWKPFSSQQRVVTQRPGFVWNAKIAVLPGLPVHVHDAYVAGAGILRPALMGLFTLIDLQGGGDIAQGQLLRFFGEAAWYPTALLPSQGVRWESVDEHSARAQLVDGAVTVSLLFRFNRDDLIESARAESRGRLIGKRMTRAAWEGKVWNYTRRDGMRVPLDGEVAWLLPEGRKPYWRGTITSMAYELAPGDTGAHGSRNR